MTGGVYRIAVLNAARPFVYIGSTTAFGRRWTEHKQALWRGNHDNPHLQAAWDKHGEDAFEFGVLEYLDDPKELHLAEQFWMDVYREEGKELYNCGTVARSPMLGRKHTAAARRRMRGVRAGLTGLSETERLARGARLAQLAKPYPAFRNERTGEVIPAGINLYALCCKRGLDQSAMCKVKHGHYRHYKGWCLLEVSA